MQNGSCIGECSLLTPECPDFREHMSQELLIRMFSAHCSHFNRGEIQAHYLIRRSFAQIYSLSLAQDDHKIAAHELLLELSRDLLVGLSSASFRSENQEIVALKLPILTNRTNSIELLKHKESNLQISLIIPRLDGLPLSVTLLVSLWKRNLFHQEYKDFRPPAIDISILEGGSGGEILSLSHNTEPISIRFDITNPQLSLDQKYKGVYWKNRAWQSDGIALRSEAAALVLESSHLSTFTLVEAASGGTALESANFLASYKVFGIVYICFEIILLSVAILVDIGLFRFSSYPHRKQLLSEFIPSKKKGQLILKYSMLYNLPLVSIFSFRDYTLLSFYRALWFVAILNLYFSVPLTSLLYRFYLARRIFLTSLGLGVAAGCFGLLHSLSAHFCKKISSTSSSYRMKRALTSKAGIPQSSSTRYLRHSSSSHNSEELNL